MAGVAHADTRTPGPHRLTIRFGPRSLALLCDDAVLWHNLERGAGGPAAPVPSGLRCRCERDDDPGCRGVGRNARSPRRWTSCPTPAIRARMRLCWPRAISGSENRSRPTGHRDRQGRFGEPRYPGPAWASCSGGTPAGTSLGTAWCCGRRSAVSRMCWRGVVKRRNRPDFDTDAWLLGEIVVPREWVK